MAMRGYGRLAAMMVAAKAGKEPGSAAVIMAMIEAATRDLLDA